MTHMQQTTFENIVTRGDIAHNEQFLILPQCFQLYLIENLSFIAIFHFFVNKFWKSSAADLLAVNEKGLTY